jgi:hypothetical protein
VPEISKDFEENHGPSKSFEISQPPEEASEEDAPAYHRYEHVGAWRTLEQRREIVLYRKKTGRWPDEVSKETGLQSYYEIRYFSPLEEHKKKYARQHALARQWWAEYKQQTTADTKETAEMDAVTPPGNVVPYRRRQSGHR